MPTGQDLYKNLPQVFLAAYTQVVLWISLALSTGSLLIAKVCNIALAGGLNKACKAGLAASVHK